MTRVLGPFSCRSGTSRGCWSKGHDHPPMVMMGHHNPRLSRPGSRAPAISRVKELLTYDLDVTKDIPADRPADRRVGREEPAHPHPPGRQEAFDAEAAIIIDILNEAWSDNWGFVPLTDAEKSPMPARR